MLVWGSATVANTLGETPAFECSACHANAPQKITHVYKWGHLWYLGAILDKQYFCTCPSCEKTTRLENSKVEKDFSASYPFNHKFGWIVWVVLISAFVIFGVITDRNNAAATRSYLEQPRVGDVYALDFADVLSHTDEFHYGTMRVSSVDGDSLRFNPSKVLYDRQTGATKAVSKADAGNFVEDTLEFSRKELDDLYARGKIYIVERPGQ